MQDKHVPKPFHRRFIELSRLAVLTIGLAWRASPGLTLGVLALVVLQAVLAPLQLLLIKGVIDRTVLDLGVRTHAPEVFVLRLPLAGLIVAAALVIAAARFVQPLASTLQEMAGDRLGGYLEEQIIQVTNRWRGLARFEDPRFADDLELVRSHAGDYSLQALLYGTRAAISLATSIGAMLILARLNPLVPMLLLLANVPQMGQEWLYRHRTGSHLYVQTPQARRLRYSREAMLAPEPAKDVRLYALGGCFLDLYRRVFMRTMSDLDRLRKRMAVRVSATSALAAAAAGAVYLYVVHSVAGGELSIGDLALYGGAVSMLASNLQMLGFEMGFLPMAFGLYIPALARVLEAPPDLPVPEHPIPAPAPIREGIVFDHVWFAYPGQRDPVLKDLSFILPPGECLALVGRNGAGKTTLVKLLLRLYDPTQGRILVDGVDLRELDLEDLRSRVGAIFQDFVRYELTAGENIALGRVEAMQDHARMAAAAERAGALGLIEGLPDGPDTQLGRELGGRELSGGEWQKLALARAFFRDAELLVLDEPTASLDVETEYAIYTRFRLLTRDKMTLLVSHRFSTVRMADRILYLEDGRVREEGSHADLMSLNGEYARLYRLQAAQYLGERSAEALT
ncbi:MAG TPA: ABC transporter ATP-binding protein [Chloroflexota bacterium]|nr:ABC transporter ATP-binding protein [Chloroflexota bacterium]